MKVLRILYSKCRMVVCFPSWNFFSGEVLSLYSFQVWSRLRRTPYLRGLEGTAYPYHDGMMYNPILLRTRCLRTS